VLSKWAASANQQVVLASHSPYFVLPEQFSSVRRLTLADGRTTLTGTNTVDLASRTDIDQEKIDRFVERELPRTFSEGFFAESVVLVEGDTDRVILETLAERLDLPLDTKGVAVVPVGGKENMRIPYAILEDLGLPLYLMADADGPPAGGAAATPAEESHKKATSALVAWLPAEDTCTTGTMPFVWGGSTTITSRWTLLHGDLEEELEQWSSFTLALRRAESSLQKKDASAYRAAALEASLEDIPDGLASVLDALFSFAGLNPAT